MACIKSSRGEVGSVIREALLTAQETTDLRNWEARGPEFWYVDTEPDGYGRPSGEMIMAIRG